MREIIFRAKTEQGEWVEGLLWKNKYKTEKLFISCFPDKDDNEEVFVVDKETIGQYIGLTDKNGKKIFEGDIVKENDIYHKGELQIKGNTWRVAFADGLFFGNFKDISVYLQSLDGMEVIGNIHDNPELLEVQNER